jgi:hypothetical protein
VHRFLQLGIDDPTGSPSGRTRGRDACTSTPERSHSASLLCLRGSAREPRRRRTSGARRGAASARLQATRSVKVPVRKPITLSGALAGGGWWLRLTEGDRRGTPVLAESVPRLPLLRGSLFPRRSILGLLPLALHDVRHGSRVTSDTAPEVRRSVAAVEHDNDLELLAALMASGPTSCGPLTCPFRLAVDRAT